MEIQETIEIIRKNRFMWCDDIQIMDAIELTLEALEKQIPTTIINQTLEYDGYYGRCPNCGSVLQDMETRDYCRYCGQAVKWK